MRLLGLHFLATAGLVAASQYSHGRIVRARDWQVTNQEVENFKFYAQWAGSAYCNDDSDPGESVVCSLDVCPDVESHNATVISSFSDKTFTSLEGFIGRDPVRSEIVLAFRGSESIRNWIADLTLSKTSCSDTGLPVSNCEIHSGFNDAWEDISDDIYESIWSAFQTYPNHTLVVTGHSLGAAVGTIAAVHLREAGYPCDLYTFGSPRVGNEGFVQFIASQDGREYRVTHSDDPVPRSPPIDEPFGGLFGSFGGGYRHTSPEYWLTVEDGRYVPASSVTSENMVLCEGIDNEECNGGTGGFDISAHRYYFRNISACAPGFQI
ncbi:hypothetical protein SLS63_009385 [Diaporthe eres]|uniref:Fungal lipase-type domain-containing protein n=1 Tax=Diaporthe eres TaxID=83184 RepID=A0ABR1P021_DIAER